MPAVPHFSLSTLPERFRAQVMNELGLASNPSVNKEKAETGRRQAPVRAVRSAATAVGNGRGRTPNSTESSFNAAILLGRGRYEPLTLHLSGGNYTPDFMTCGFPASDSVGTHTIETGAGSGVPVLYEVKGSYRLPTHGRSVFAFKQACAEYPAFVFVFAEQVKAKGKGGGNVSTWNIGIYRNGMMLGNVCGLPDEVRAVIQRTIGMCGNAQNADSADEGEET